MAVIISDSTNPNYDGNLSTASGFYRVEAYNLGAFNAATLAITSAKYIPVTFANAGNCQGIVLLLRAGQSSLVYDSSVTVTLQENVASVWTDRATKTLSSAEITHSLTYATGNWITPLVFGTPYAVTTSASTWRFKVEQTGGATGNWFICTSDGTNAFYATWCDNAVSFTNGDVPICKDVVTIDRTATFSGVLGTGATLHTTAAVICCGADFTKANQSNLVWENPPAASYTLSIDGKVLMGSGSGWQIGAEASPIPTAQKAIIDYLTPSAGTSVYSGVFLPMNSTSAAYITKGVALFAYGESPTYVKTQLAEDAAASQANIVTTDATGWSAGDIIYISKEDSQAATDITPYEIDSISGTDITLTGNLAKKRIAGGVVGTITGYGIEMTSSSSATSYGYNLLSGPCNYFEMSGIFFKNVQFLNFMSNSGFAPSTMWYDTAYSDDNLIENSMILDTLASNSGHFLNGWFCEHTRGITVQNCMSVYKPFISFNAPSSSAPFSYDGRYVVDNCCSYGTRSSAINLAVSFLLYTINNNRFENIGVQVCANFKGTDIIFTNNYVYGCSASWGAMFWGGTSWNTGNSVISGNSYQRINYVHCFLAVIMNSHIESDSDFGSEYANTAVINISGTGQVIDLEFKSCTGQITEKTGMTPWVYAIDGSRIIVTDEDNVTNEDRMTLAAGKFQRTGDGLTDTTVHTSGTDKFAIRFEPTTTDKTLRWQFDVPTGNIEDKTMMVGVWCKIASATYYAGTHQMPRLTINYDNGTTAYSQAVQTTDWQYLSLSFTPTTTYGQITVTVSSVTDATTTDAYVYFDDFSILYPAGYQLNLGAIDLWANGLPITPPIATNLSAQDVWSAASTTDYGTNTMGSKLGNLESPSLVLGGTIVV